MATVRGDASGDGASDGCLSAASRSSSNKVLACRKKSSLDSSGLVDSNGDPPCEAKLEFPPAVDGGLVAKERVTGSSLNKLNEDDDGPPPAPPSCARRRREVGGGDVGQGANLSPNARCVFRAAPRRGSFFEWPLRE